MPNTDRPDEVDAPAEDDDVVDEAENEDEFEDLDEDEDEEDLEDEDEVGARAEPTHEVGSEGGSPGEAAEILPAGSGGRGSEATQTMEPGSPEIIVERRDDEDRVTKRAP
jgi:hypothetical protein